MLKLFYIAFETLSVYANIYYINNVTIRFNIFNIIWYLFDLPSYRKNNEYVNAPILHNFDWTYFTKYPGTLDSKHKIVSL